MRAEQPIAATLLGHALWRRIDGAAMEHCRLLQLADAYVMQGCVLTVVAGEPAEVHYLVECDARWTTRSADVRVVAGESGRRVHVRRDEAGEWWRDDAREPDFDGLTDIDLHFTPATNTIPIRRMALDIGAAAPTEAVWLRFPELTLERLPQQYTRTGPYRYRYESRDGSFTADLDVDEHGLVARYGEVWERLAP